MSMINVIETVMYIAFTVFAIYGIFVLRKWHKVAVKTDAMLDETGDEISERKEGADHG